MNGEGRMNASEVLELADLNLAEAAREIARWQPDHRVEEREDMLLVADADPFPVGYGNSVMALGTRAPESAEALVARADRFFGQLGRGYTVWIRDHLDGDLEAHLQGTGLSSFAETPGMVLDAPIPDRPLEPGLRVVQVEDTASAGALGAVEAAGYATVGMPRHVTEGIFSTPERFINPHTVVVLGYLEERPVAAAIANLSHGIAGLYWVVTLPEARGRGLGEACTRLAGNRAFELGARCVILQASAQGEPIYLRMGYREITRYRWYAKGPPA
jgi:ribosomal protein S18 acetylase RimI-like enzyme